MPDFAPSADARALAAELADACRRMAALDLPQATAMRLHRQFIAICDAIKAANADMATGHRRLTAFLAALDSAASSAAAGPPAGALSRDGTPTGTTPLR